MRERRAIVLTVVTLVVAGGRAGSQEAASKAKAAPRPATVADPSARFRFIERYAVEPDKAKPAALSQYQVATLETVKITVEQPQGAPQRSQTTFQTMYTERPARVGTGSGGDVLDAVRRYEYFRSLPDRSRPDDAHPLEGLTLWYHPRIGDEPQMLSLTERELRESEYRFAAQHMFLPDLRGLLPTQPTRVGESWRVLVSAARALFCDPAASRCALNAKLVDVREVEPKGEPRRWSARITVAGQALLALYGPTTVNAEIDFQFAPPAPAAAGATTKPAAQADESVLEAQGSMSALRMAISAAIPRSGDPNERLRQITTREFIVSRRPLAENATPLRLPSEPPAPTEANSWLTVISPDVPKFPHFVFRHPQELLPPPGPPPLPNEVVLVDRVPETRDKITFEVLLKTGTTEDRQARDPEKYRQSMLAEWEKQRLDVVQGPHGWLPAEDWAPVKMKVYRIQAALKETRRETRHEPRTYLDFYLVLFSRDECLIVEATTSQDPPTAFRKQTEAILKTFRFDPPKSAR